MRTGVSLKRNGRSLLVFEQLSDTSKTDYCGKDGVVRRRRSLRDDCKVLTKRMRDKRKDMNNTNIYRSREAKN